MSEVKPNLMYTKADEWVLLEGEVATIGITDYAQEALNDIVYLELPEVGSSFNAEEEFGVVESVKAAADLLMPITGEVVEVNEALIEAPEDINEDPYGSWMIKVKVADADAVGDLMDAAAYTAYCAER